MTEISEIPPSYLTTNQSEERPRADQAACNPLPQLAFKNPSPKARGEFKSFEPKLPILHAGHLAINTVLSFTTIQCQYTGFAVHGASGPKFGLVIHIPCLMAHSSIFKASNGASWSLSLCDITPSLYLFLWLWPSCLLLPWLLVLSSNPLPCLRGCKLQRSVILIWQETIRREKQEPTGTGSNQQGPKWQKPRPPADRELHYMLNVIH